MKSSKIRAPSSKKAPAAKLQCGVFPDPLLWSDDFESGSDPEMVLHDGASSAEAPPYDFGERTARFGERVIRLAKLVPRHPVNDRLIGQLVGAATSVGANYCEANEAITKKDFRYNIGRCLKEAKEARFFLRMLATSESALAADCRILWREATELLRILAAMRK